MASYGYGGQIQSHRGAAMLMAVVLAVVLSPLYVNYGAKRSTQYESRLGSGFVLPVVLAGLIIAIKTTTSPPSAPAMVPSPEASWVLRIGSSSWGLAGVLVMLLLVLSWQESVQHFLWK